MSGVFQNIDPHPLTARRVCASPPLVRGEDTLAGRRGGWGVNNLEDARHCSVYSTLNLSPCCFPVPLFNNDNTVGFLLYLLRELIVLKYTGQVPNSQPLLYCREVFGSQCMLTTFPSYEKIFFLELCLARKFHMGDILDTILDVLTYKKFSSCCSEFDI
jgi:hypothetical protein